MKNHREFMAALLAGETVTDLLHNWWKINDNDQIMTSPDTALFPNVLHTLSIKPRTININGFNVPIPLRIEPERRTPCWCCWWTTIKIYYDPIAHHEYFTDGLLHSTLEAAELHRKAMVSFTKNV